MDSRIVWKWVIPIKKLNTFLTRVVYYPPRLRPTILHFSSKMSSLANHAKFLAGRAARAHWSKALVPEESTMTSFNETCGGIFTFRGNIVLDPSERRQTTLLVKPDDDDEWKRKNTEHIYVIVRDGRIMKIGGTRTGMKDRWSSYMCGHCVPQRLKKRTGEPFPGKMSVTNAHLYHTIEGDLLAGHEWSFWSWKLPTVTVSVEILGVPTTVIAQTYHAYESRCMANFRTLAGHIPQLCDNSDPSYR